VREYITSESLSETGSVSGSRVWVPECDR